MDAKAAKLALIALAYGAERIPDKVFESLPGHYFKPKEPSKQDKKSREHQRSRSVNHRAPIRPNSTSPKRAFSPPRYDRRSEWDKMSHDHHSHGGGHRTYQKYYTTGEPVREYDEYYAPEYQRSNQLQVRNHADRYDDRASYDSRNYSRASSEPRHSHHKSRHRRRSRSSSASSSGSDHKSHRRSLSRMKQKAQKSRSQVRESVEDHVDLNAAGIGASAAGALAGGLAGGLLGHEVGHGKMTTIGGALLGGIGANLLEKHEKEKHERLYNSNERRRRSSSRHRRRSSFGG